MYSSLNKWFKNWKSDVYESKYLVLISIIFLILSGVISYYASTYADSINATSVSDIILDNIPTVNLSIIFVYGIMLVGIITFLYTLLFKIKEFHKIAFLYCLIILVRSVFITLTHLGMPSDAITNITAPGFYNALFFHNDLFFSGHVAMPLMGFLIFRKEAIEIFFLIMTVILGTTALFMHLHYTIDILGAVFITYGVYKFGMWVMNNQHNSITH